MTIGITVPVLQEGLPAAALAGIGSDAFLARQHRCLTSRKRRAGTGEALYGGVPKWTKGTDCKSVIQGFESLRRLLDMARKYPAS